MKRLLAYLFIVLGFGLTFNVSASMALMLCESSQSGNGPSVTLSGGSYCTQNRWSVKKQDKFIKFFLNRNTSLENYNNHLSMLLGGLRAYKKSHGTDPELLFSMILSNEEFIKKSKKFLKDNNKKINESSIAVAKKYYKDFKNKTQIAKYKEKITEKSIVVKKEPSQTQKVAGKKVDLIFCDTLGVGQWKYKVYYKGYVNRDTCNQWGYDYKSLNYNDFRFLTKNQKMCVRQGLNGPILTKKNCEYFNLPEIKFDSGKFYYNSKIKTQIAKAEPSQPKKKQKKYCLFRNPDGTTAYRSHAAMTVEVSFKCPIPQVGYGTWEEISFVDYKKYNPKLYVDETQIAETEKTVVPKKKVKVAKVEEPKQEEFKPENKDIDNDAPVIEIAQNITVDSQSYTLKGKVKDKSRFQLTIDDRPIKVDKNGQFEFEGFAIDSKEQLKIVAIDRWKNKSEKKVNVEVKIKQVADLRSYEKPNPSKIKVKKDNNKIGIIIGIEKYQNLNNIDAPYANRDAKAFKAYANIALGIPNNNLKVLIDEDATRGELLKSLKIWLPQITRGKEKDIYIFFAGHGLASDNGEDLHILPHNGDPILLEDTALSRVEMFDLINKVSPKSVTMFFDTCYSGQTRSEQMLVAGLRPVRIVANEQDTPNNFTIFTASNYDQTSGSINEAEHGIFSYYLMKGLEGKADENSDKKITNGELISYLKNNVTQEAFSQNRSQEPMLSGDPDKVLISYR